jgi:hypothetical protein
MSTNILIITKKVTINAEVKFQFVQQSRLPKEKKPVSISKKNKIKNQKSKIYTNSLYISIRH